MKWLTVLMLSIVMAGGAWAQVDVVKGETKAFAWRDFRAAFAEAQTSKKMIFVDIYTNW